MAITELALSMMLLIAAALLARSFSALVSVKPGLEPNELLIARIRLARHRYTDTAQMETFYAALKQRLRVAPGVAAVSVADGVPPVPGTFRSSLTITSESGNVRSLSLGTLRLASVVADDEYFDALGIPLLAGRSFNVQDAPAAPMSVVIDPDLAHALWPNQSPLGQRFRLSGRARAGARWEDPWLTVIGVAGEVKMMGPDDRNAPYVIYYSSRQQEPWITRTVAVRAIGDPTALYPVIRDAVRALDAEQPIASMCARSMPSSRSLRSHLPHRTSPARSSSSASCSRWLQCSPFSLSFLRRLVFMAWCRSWSRNAHERSGSASRSARRRAESCASCSAPESAWPSPVE
jgi:putative ABC transport system permease protein